MVGMNLFGGIHRGFTPPSSGALKILNFGEDLDNSGLDLDAEKSWNKELGVRGTLSLIEYEFAGFGKAKNLFLEKSVKMNGNKYRHFLRNNNDNPYFYDEYQVYLYF